MVMVMCGRYCLTVDSSALLSLFGLGAGFIWTSRYNVAPTQMMPVVRASQMPLEDGVGPHLDCLRWGLIPSWSKDVKAGARMINARSETVCEKPAFRSAVRHRRCLVPADGFFEWKKLSSGIKKPYCIRMHGGSLFAFAGIWERWQGDLGQVGGLFEEAGADLSGDVVESSSILTTRPNRLMGAIHDRMPVILNDSDFSQWLDPEITEVSDVEALIDRVAQPFDELAMEAYPVSPQMNHVGFEGPGVLEPLQDTE